MNRRKLLKNTGVGLTAAVGLAGTASAERTDVEQLPQVDPWTVRAAVADDPALLEELADDGVIATATVDEFDFEATGSESVGVVERGEDGTPARRLSRSLSVEAGELALGVHPDDGAAFAILDRGGDRIAYGNVDAGDCFCSHVCCYGLCCCQWTCVY